MTPEVVESLVLQLESKDHSTAAHTWRVVLYARALAEQFEVDSERLASITVGAALHDVGKLDVPTQILTKAGPLTDEEFAVIKQHPVLGFDRLVNLGETDPVVLGLVRSHHERIDGQGYPDRLGESAIPPAARYFAVIDTFDALTSVRPYRAEVGPAAAEHAIEELHRGIGSRYCAECVDAFVRLYRRGDLMWILEYYNDRIDLPYATSRPARASPWRVRS